MPDSEHDIKSTHLSSRVVENVFLININVSFYVKQEELS